MAGCRRRISTTRIGVLLVALGTLGYLAVVTVHIKLEDRLPVEFSQGRSSLQSFKADSMIGADKFSKKEFAMSRAIIEEQHGARPMLGEMQAVQIEDPPFDLLAVQRANFDRVDLIRTDVSDRENDYFATPEDGTPEELVEHSSFRTHRSLTLLEEEGGDILLTLRTTGKYHNKRLSLLFETWMTKINLSHLFIVTDRWDEYWMKFVKEKGAHYINAECGKSYLRDELCCKAGVEMQLLFQEGNEQYNWLCHVDDDMYVLGKPLVKTLSKFNPSTEPVYFGRSGSPWKEPRKVLNSSTLGIPGEEYHFAVGGMYCLSRAMLELANPYLVGGSVFAKSCSQTKEPEDVTVGLVVGAVLNLTLSRTELIHTHGLHLASTVLPDTLHQQIAVSYGFGSEKWGYSDYNAVYVPFPLYALSEDESQFHSIHCHLYPEERSCQVRAKLLASLNRTIELFW